MHGPHGPVWGKIRVPKFLMSPESLDGHLAFSGLSFDIFDQTEEA